MDPTAPKDNDQSSQANENPESPVQTGGFVVSGEPGGIPDPDQSPQPIQPDPLSAQPTSSQPAPPIEPAAPSAAGSDLQSDLQSTVVAATGTNLAGSMDPTALPQDNPLAPQETTLPTEQQQPDPTPFTPPPSPLGGAPAPDANPAGVPQPPGTPPSQGESKAGKMKSLIIVVAVFILVAILAAVAWYFILNKGQTQEDNTTTDTRPIELPSSPSPKTSGGFGDLPSPTPEATAPADIEEGDPQL